MANDVRIDRVTTDVNVTDASAMLSPQVMERIVQAVLERLEQQKREQEQAESERALGAARRRNSH